MHRLLPCLFCCGLAASPGVAQAGDSGLQLKPGTIIVCAQEKVKVGAGRAIAYVWSGNAKNMPVILGRESKLADITSFVVARNGRQFYLDGLHGNPMIMQADKGGKNERLFYRHNVGLCRQLALDNEDNVYFSVAGGKPYASRPGPDVRHHIYKVRPADNEKAATAELFCEVPLLDLVEKHWAGGFAFGPRDGGGFDTKTLCLCVRAGAGGKYGSIYRMTRTDGAWSKPARVLASKEPIDGLVFTGPREAYYAATQNFSTDPAKWSKVVFCLYRFTDLKKTEPVHSLDIVGKIWSVSVVRGDTRVLLRAIVKDKK